MDEVNRQAIRAWGRWVLGIVVGVAIAVLITDVRVTDVQRDGCERRQEAFRAIAGSIQVMADDPRNNAAESSSLRANAQRVRDNIVNDCAAAYPHIIPFVR